MEIYDVGDQPTITVTLTDKDGALTDPAAVSISIKSPSGVTTLYTYGSGGPVNRDSKGVYSLDLPLTEAGDWKYKWNATGASDQGYISVRRSLA